ncbi:D-alanyl-D-alanine carboxypeptidase [Christiangramia forsetii]|uniref:D-alanyl-D-alanine carboxypeptidase/D-alanyl-D-alanine endopeptidase n=2 Tax=Christiangramia forsetii TaxID=411153 RepID=A0M516_CHRFK|nr:D-alanyl-D-alanine carboxypeptidase [Christiangramia forsetii]GGG22088.1 D-alanyl-D-alanine carboxypeptidase [Christiangramia forsetii]CAL67711.1 D-alanyl-D-alanine carboxypeptidase/D-alanyl-D-alanine endopeptidase [Christiangramia forsetii KT0803]
MIKHSVKLSIAVKSMLFLSSLLIISCSAIKKTNKEIETDFHESPVFKKGYAGFALYDPAIDKMLYTHNAEKYFTPASNTKLFSLYTGLKILGGSIPALKYTTVGDSLIFKGTGDPSFLNPELPKSHVWNFLKNSDKKLFYAPPVFKEKRLGSGWAWDDYDSYYSAEKIDFPIYGNLIEIKFEKGASKPSIKPGLLSDSIHAIKPAKVKNKYVQREIASNKMEYQNFPREEDFTQNIPFNFSSELIVKLLSDTLNRKVEIYRGDTKTLKFNKTLYSVPGDSIYKRMMQVSDNFIAEQILLMAADKISDSLKTSIAIDYMKENYLGDLLDEAKWVDGSGLSRYNLFTPRSMIKLIEKIEKEMPKEELFKILAAGGESGTLKNYYKAETPYIYAKTGTLRNNHSLSGFLITKSGKTLIFSFMNSNYTVPTSELKQGMTRILEMIRDNY